MQYMKLNLNIKVDFYQCAVVFGNKRNDIVFLWGGNPQPPLIFLFLFYFIFLNFLPIKPNCSNYAFYVHIDLLNEAKWFFCGGETPQPPLIFFILFFFISFQSNPPFKLRFLRSQYLYLLAYR